jgi:hypothetical protein
VPELNDTIAIAMLRPWVDVGRVGTLTLNKLEQYLGAKELGRLARPGQYYDFTRYRPRTRMVQGKRTLSIPNTVVNYAHDDRSGLDFLFLHMREPHSMGEDYTGAVVELLRHFGVAEYCRVGGMYDSVPHTRPLMVTGSLSEELAEKTKGLLTPRRSTYQGPTSIVNLVGDAMTEDETATTSLMVHLPQYVQLDEDHYGAARLTEILCAAYGFPETLADKTRGQQQYRDINRAVENNDEVKNLIGQLEAYYDRMLAPSRTQTDQPREEEEPINLAPDVEQFLREMGQRLNEDEEGGDSESGPGRE